MKKVLLLVVALAALALPASAGASVWTYSHLSEVGPEEFELVTSEMAPEEVIPQQFEGRFGFSHYGPQYWNMQGSFLCDATIEIEAEGPSAGRIVGFDRDASSCEGTGHWAGFEATKLSSNIAAGWNVDVSASPYISVSGGSLQVTNQYNGWLSETKAFSQLDLVPTLDGEGKITQFMLEGWETNGVVHEVIGPFTPVESPEYELGLK